MKGCEIVNRTELGNKVALDSKSAKSVSHAWTAEVCKSLADAIAHEKRVSIINFGVFEHVVRPPKSGRNYKTGERVYIPSRTVIKFTPCASIAEAVREEHIRESEK